MNSKILIIEDEADLLEMEKHRLELGHYEVITATDGVEGLYKARIGKPDLIVLDVLLPHLDGYSLLRELKQDPAMSAIPVIVLTTRDQLRNLFEMEGISSENYLIKPFDGKKLVNRIETLLAQSEDV